MFYKDGWNFERLGDGSVKICRKIYPAQFSPGVYDHAAPAEVITEVVVDPHGWASIVASVSARGEENERFYEALKFHQAQEKSYSTEVMLIRNDINALFEEIKNYTNQHPGEIHSADLPAKLMLGFVHDDGTYWAIKLIDVKKSISKNPSNEGTIRNILMTAKAKEELCATLSNPVKK